MQELKKWLKQLASQMLLAAACTSHCTDDELFVVASQQMPADSHSMTCTVQLLFGGKDPKCHGSNMWGGKNQHLPRSCRFESRLGSVTFISLDGLWRPQICITARKEDQDRAKKAGSPRMLDSAGTFHVQSATTGKGCRAFAGVAREGATLTKRSFRISPIKAKVTGD